MNNERWLNNNDVFIQKITEYKVKCSHCGHTMYLIKRCWRICDWCGHKVYKNKKEEFKDKLKKVIK